MLDSLLEDLFMGNEMIPDVLDEPPLYPLDLIYKTIRTYPGMRLTADMTRFKPMLHWPADPNAYYTVVISNLDINNRRNRSGNISTFGVGAENAQGNLNFYCVLW